MIENIFARLSLTNCFFLMIGIFLDILKNRMQKNKLKIEVSKMRFVASTIITLITTMQSILGIIYDVMPKQMVSLYIIMVPMWIVICKRDYKDTIK